MAYYVRGTNTLYLLNDAGATYAAGNVGSSGSLSNSQCSVNLSTSSVSASGTHLILNLVMGFTTGYAGTKNVYMFGTNGSVNSGWQTRGTWTVPAAAITVTADSVTPSSGSGVSQMFALQYSDTAGATDLTQGWVWINSSFASSAANSCFAYYVRGTNTLYLLNDAGTTYAAGNVGSSGNLSNSQCSVNLSTSSVSVSGTHLVLNLAMGFTTAYAGTKNVYMYGTNGTVNSGWQTRGTWTVPATVTADSVTPSSGSGAGQMFALQYSDT